MPRSWSARTMAVVGGALLALCLCIPSQAEAKRKPRGKKPAAAAEAAPQEGAGTGADTQPAPDTAAAPAGAEPAPQAGDTPPSGAAPQLSPEEADRLAREHFEQGRADYDQGNYRDAWDHFHQAYGLSDRPELLYNIGQTADRLGRAPDALAAFRLYLERNPDADNRREVENRIRALEDRVKSDEEAQAGKDDSSAPAAPPRAQPTREGLYLRVGLGLGFLVNARTTTDTSTMAGASTGTEIWVGHSVMRGLALGGGLYFDIAFKLTGSTESGAPLEDGATRLTMFGGGADWYPWASRNGVHFQAAVALARLSSDTLSADIPTGGGALLGGGYEWPIAREWGLGVLGRVTIAALDDGAISHTVLAASAQVSATWF